MKASDLAKQLNADPEYQEMQKRKAQELSEREALLAEDERGLVQELNEKGFKIKSVWDFVNTNNRYEFLRAFKGSYKGAYPTLVKHLNVNHHPRTREGIIRSLTENDANAVASEALIAAFNQEHDSNLKWVLANALRTVLSRSQKRKHPEYKEVYGGTNKP